ncbi:MAG: hypothetical protein J7647_27320 [Cyanobacteria bacterium SBLK]|nr:hypothetical protein [Cyanobacteria bacterium SBLK]
MSYIHRNDWGLKVVGGIVAAIAIALSPTSASAQIERATVREIFSSEEVGNLVFIDEIPAQIDDIAAFQQEVSTEEAFVELEFNNGAAGRLASQSSVIIGQCVEVRQGLLLASGPANGCTATFEVGVEGTFYLLEASDRGSRIQVLNGTVNLRPLSPDANNPPNPIVLRGGQQLAIDPAGIFGQIFPLSQEEVEGILQDSLFRDFESRLPGMKKLQQALERLYPDIHLPRLPGFKKFVPPLLPSSPAPSAPPAPNYWGSRE